MLLTIRLSELRGEMTCINDIHARHRLQQQVIMNSSQYGVRDVVIRPSFRAASCDLALVDIRI